MPYSTAWLVRCSARSIAASDAAASWGSSIVCHISANENTLYHRVICSTKQNRACRSIDHWLWRAAKGSCPSRPSVSAVEISGLCRRLKAPLPVNSQSWPSPSATKVSLPIGNRAGTRVSTGNSSSGPWRVLCSRRAAVPPGGGPNPAETHNGALEKAFPRPQPRSLRPDQSGQINPARAQPRRPHTIAETRWRRSAPETKAAASHSAFART